MNALIDAAAQLQRVCDAHGWQYCFIGGLAVLRWGEPRETVDVDLTLLTGFGSECAFVSVLVQAFQPRIENAVEFAEANRVLLLEATSGVGLDVSLAGLPFEARVIERSSLFRYPPDVHLRTCSADDLVVLKAFADRGKDWLDIEGIVIRQADVLQWDYIEEQLLPLVELKEAPDIVERLRATRRRLTSR